MIEFTASNTAICTMAMWVATSGGGCPAPGVGAVVGLPNAARACPFQSRSVALVSEVVAPVHPPTAET